MLLFKLMGSLKRFDLDDIINKYQLKIFIETGTGRGDSLFYAAKHSFEQCFSIEIHDKMYKKSAKIFNADYIKVIHGESVESLKQILSSCNDDPILFFLDAHCEYDTDCNLLNYNADQVHKSNMPISDELNAIKKYRKKNRDVIIIDDLRFFYEEYKHNPLPEGFEPFPEVMENCKAHFGVSHDFVEVHQDEGYLALLPRMKYQSGTSMVRDIVMPYIKGAKKIADIGFGGDKIMPNAIGIDYECPYAYTGDDVVDIGCDVSKGIPVEDDFFDCVYSSHLVEDFEDTESILKEFIRILKPNGILASVVPNEQVYRKYCEENNHPYNSHHKIDDMDANYLEEILHGMGVEFDILLKENLLIDYNAILIARIK